MFNAPTGFQFFKLLIAGALILLPWSCAAQQPHPDKPHHTENGFKNNYLNDQSRFFDFLKWRWNRLWEKTPDPESYHFPLAENNPEFLASNTEKNTLTWIGHATLLVQIDGKNILTDPLFSDRASPVQWAGPKRVVPPGLSLDDLPPIDIVVISHNHYDALDIGSIKRLHERDGARRTKYFVPLGLGRWFRNKGFNNVVELDWWDRYSDKDLDIIAVPVQHWSKRTLLSRNTSLWAGWVIRSKNFSFFFSGDSGYTPDFKDVGRRMGPFDLSAIPIGAYEPRWFMRDYHMSPEEALEVHLDVQSKLTVGIHWGTFILTDEPLDDPPARLENAMKNKGTPEEAFVVLMHGETIVVD
ncbi:MBL fold metallo-hydrolase [Thermodesulfobacteriota bacterium]